MGVYDEKFSKFQLGPTFQKCYLRTSLIGSNVYILGKANRITGITLQKSESIFPCILLNFKYIE
jgi:hypothetical protein